MKNRPHIDITIGDTRLIQDDKGQTIVIDGKSSFVCWEVLEMPPAQLRETMALNIKRLMH